MKASGLRVLILVLLSLFLTGASIILGLVKNLFLDEVIILALFDAVFILSFIIYITKKRLANEIYEGSNYVSILIIFVVNFILLLAASFLNDFYFPFGLIPILFAAFLDDFLAYISTIFYSLIFAVVMGLSSYTFYAYIFIAGINVLICSIQKGSKRNLKIVLGLTLATTNFLISFFFSYLVSYEILPIDLFIYFASSVALMILYIIGFNKLFDLHNKERQFSYELAVDESNPILSDMKRISINDYNHGVRVANLSGDCAELIGADRMLCMCGGLYYNALSYTDKEKLFKELNDRCYPPDLVRLLKEKENLSPTNKEGAIVHITDTLLKKLETFKANQGLSDWDTSMFVYQTLNDCSSSGIYDKSGLTMNEFLKIRDYLAKVEYSY